MKRLVAFLVGLAMVAALTGCGKQPVAEIENTKAAVLEAVNEGSDIYVVEDFKAVEDKMAAAMAEIKIQDGKLLKNYDKAAEMLAAVKAEAEAVKTKAIVEHDRLKQQAASDLAKASEAVSEARTLVENAPVGKGSAADIVAMKADVVGLEAAVDEIEPLIAASNYSEASGRSLAVSVKANVLSTEIKAAMAKMAAASQAKPRKKK